MFKISFKPDNYKRIDNCLSRSAQPNLRGLRWLAKNGVTDVISFRTMYKHPDVSLKESQYAKSLGLHYHQIPTITNYPKKESVGKFLDIIEGVKQKGGCVHLHCSDGGSRTGFYSYIYERLNNIGNKQDSINELTQHNWNKEKYPFLDEWADAFVAMFKK